MIPFVDLKKQYKGIENKIVPLLGEIMEEGNFVLGSNLQSFEGEFAKYCGVKYAVGVGSGTDALHLALLAGGIKTGDEVITTSNTFIATALAISLTGASPVFVDIDPRTYTMDPEKLEEYLRARSEPKAVIPVHLYGHPTDMDSILEVARKYGLKVIEDACQAHGAEYYSSGVGGRGSGANSNKFRTYKAGSMGDLGCFSFYPSKNLGGFGDGGMVVTDNEELAERVRLLRNYGREERYYHVIKGFNSRLDEIQATILRVKLKMLDKWNEERRIRAKKYDELLSEADLALPRQEEYARHVYHLYVIRTKMRDGLQRHLHKKGIQTLIHYPIPIHLQKAYEDLGYQKGDLPVAEEVTKEILSLPMFPELEYSQLEYVANSIREFYK